ncbi:MAG: class I SAM-dependent methyltransferase [Candidatus Krumholzibacteria bacterium]|jgi:SAM-dependent methyltransferase|nr:class I SAM-dependent methyltransferase [Candidatus Krumholzibacteria bacterium]
MDELTPFDRRAGDYDRWFDENPAVYQAELRAVRRFIPETGSGVEIGAGTGRFAIPLGIAAAVEPSGPMARIAKDKNLPVCRALGERLPFHDDQFDFALLATVVCFVADPALLFREAGRVIKPGGRVIVAFIDRETEIGRLYESRKDANGFYRGARFYSAREIEALLLGAGFGSLKFCQTIIGLPDKSGTPPGEDKALRLLDGSGEGGFAVACAVTSTSP